MCFVNVKYDCPSHLSVAFSLFLALFARALEKHHPSSPNTPSQRRCLSSSSMVLYERTPSNSNAMSSSPSSKRKNSGRRHRIPGSRPNRRIEPSNEDAENTRKLEDTLRNLGVYDSKEGLLRRRTALERLQEILNLWAQSVGPSAAKESKWHRPAVALISFGSYRLGVHQPDADIDVLALSPPTCSRGDFFTSLVQMFKEDKGVTELHPIPVAYTPVIKFKMEGISIDLLFARLSNSTKLLQPVDSRNRSTDFIIDDADLVGMDEAEMRSLNGSRVAQMLLRLVPNQDHFRVVLRAVKEWATVHGLYSNVLGFLGGINWAILVANVCMVRCLNMHFLVPLSTCVISLACFLSQRYPDALPSLLLRYFFREFASWKWPAPVALAPIADQPPPGVSPLPVWNPKLNPRDRHHIMPIITPAYPSMNSSYNVGVPQLRRIQIELTQADQLMDVIGSGKATLRDLFVGNNFFQRHMHFLQVNITANNASDFLEWFRLCESRLRILITGLESPECGVEVFPFAKFFDRKYSKSGLVVGAGKSDEDCKTESCFFMALRFAFGVENVDLRYCTSEFLHKVNSWEGRRLGMDLSIEHVMQKDLPTFLYDSETKGMGSNRRNTLKKKTGRPPTPDTRPLSPALGRKLKISDDNDDVKPEKTGPSVPSPAKRART